MYAFSGKMHRRNFNGIRRELFQWNFLHTMPILFKTLLWYSSLKFEKGMYFPYTFVHKVFCIEFCTGHRRGTGTYQCTLVKCFCIASLLSAKEEEPVPLREGFKKSKWKFKMAFAIRRPTPPPLMAKFPDIFLPHFFLLQLNPTYMKQILHFKNITFTSSYNWFKVTFTG